MQQAGALSGLRQILLQIALLQKRAEKFGLHIMEKENTLFYQMIT